MKHLYFFAALLVVPLVSFSQTDSLETEILNYSPSQSEIISKGRRLLLDAVVAEDFEKASDIREYLLQEVNSDDYIVFYPAEHWLLLYWSGDYDELLTSLKSFDEAEIQGLSAKIFPLEDRLFFKLMEKSLQWREKLDFGIWRASVSEEEKDFLRLNLAWLLEDDTRPEYLERINARADEFLEGYPESEYEEYVRHQLRHKYVSSDWGFGFEFFSGYGLFTGDLANSFTNPVPLGIDFYIEYKKMTLYMRLFGGFGKTSADISDAGGSVWAKGALANTVLGEFSFGYAVAETDKIKLSPFAGIGISEIGATEEQIEENPDLEHMKVGSDIAYTLGANLDFKLGWNTGEALENTKTYWYLRLRYGHVLPQFGGDYSGGIHTLTLGIGGVFRTLKREL